MKLRGFYTRLGDLKFISHLNTIDLLQRAAMFTGAKIIFTEGFNPHPKMSFGNPLPLGVSSEMEVFDIDVADETDIEKFKFEANKYLPKEVQIKKIFDATNDTKISKLFNYSIYEFFINTKIDLTKIKLDVEDELLIQRKKKNKKKKRKEIITEDISFNVELLSDFEKIGENEYKLTAKLENSIAKIINPMNFINGIFNKYNLEISEFDVIIHKKDMIS